MATVLFRGDAMNTLIITYPVCECGVAGDLLIQTLDNRVEHAWCKVCGCKIDTEQH